jgi:hypothetical protein
MIFVHPAESVKLFSISGSVWEILGVMLGMAAAYAGVLGLHELIHGAFFWIFTGARPIFGLRLAYAYAAAPDWYIPRNAFLMIGLAPLVLISLGGAALLPAMPPSLLPIWWLALTANASGAVGDLYIVGWLLSKSAHLYINDCGDRMSVYAPR